MHKETLCISYLSSGISRAMSGGSVIAHPAQWYIPPGPAHDLFTCPEALRDLDSDVL